MRIEMDIREDVQELYDEMKKTYLAAGSEEDLEIRLSRYALACGFAMGKASKILRALEQIQENK